MPAGAAVFSGKIRRRIVEAAGEQAFVVVELSGNGLGGL
jgi:hypothetical protein